MPKRIQGAKYDRHLLKLPPPSRRQRRRMLSVGSVRADRGLMSAQLFVATVAMHMLSAMLMLIAVLSLSRLSRARGARDVRDCRDVIPVKAVAEAEDERGGQQGKCAGLSFHHPVIVAGIAIRCNYFLVQLFGTLPS